MTSTTTTKRPLIKRSEFCDSEVKNYETSPCHCGWQLLAIYSCEDRDYFLYDEAGFINECAVTLAEANELSLIHI